MKEIGILILVSIVCQISFAGAITVGNGGTVVRCSGRGSFQSLDYVLTKNMLGKHTGPVKISGLNESLQRISDLISTKIPSWKISFQEYVGLIANTDTSKSYVWKVPPYPLRVIQDEIIPFPLTCRNNFESIDIQQAVVREIFIHPELKSSQVIFYYDPEILFQLNRDPLQMSFLMVHEWLWNHVKNDEQNRKVNYFLHSTFFEQLTPSETKTQLRNLGLDLKEF